MPFDGFLKIDGISGESTDDKHKDWIEVLYYQHGATQPSSATASSSGGGSTERATHHPFIIQKEIDKASPLLLQACCSGKHFATVTLQLCRAGGDKVQYMEVKMDQVVVSGVHITHEPLSTGLATVGGKTMQDSQSANQVASQTGKAGSTLGALPTETVTFDFGKIKWTYTQQKRADGTGGGNVTGGWDLTANKVNS